MSLNDYILQDKIGSGAFGKVYRVKYKQDNKICAAKISIYSINETTEELFQNLSREVNIISKLNHPSIIKFILYSPLNFKLKPKPVIITEYASNGSLSQLIEHDKSTTGQHILNDTMKLKIIYGIASAMSYLHSHNILHRDLKPDNVLLDNYLFPKVGDFGLSKSDSNNYQQNILHSTGNGNIKGTPAFISPEIWSDGKYSKSSDVYAFSIVVYEIMTCEKAFPNANFYSLIAGVIKRNRPEFNVFVPDAYKYLIIRCWSHDPEERPTFDEILNELKTNKEYITDNVDEKEFFEYVNFIENYKISFDSDNFVIPFISAKDYHIYNNSKKNNQFKKITDFLYLKALEFPFEYFEIISEKSAEIVKKAISGDADMQLEVGRNLIEGRYDFPFDVQTGICFLIGSINNGKKESLIYYIEMLIKGDLIPVNNKEVRKLLDEKFSEDESTRLLLEGKLLKKEKQYSEAAECFNKSMELNNSDSFYEYAELVRNGFLNNIKPEKCKEYYKRAIEIGNLKAMYKLGKLLYKNKEKKDQEEGIQMIKNAADKGNLNAMYYYGTIVDNENCSTNEYIKTIVEESMNYYKRAADEGHGKSMNKYGVTMIKYARYLTNLEKVKEAIPYLKKAMAKGFIESMYQYGATIIEGDAGIERNEEEGARYIRIAALNEFPNAMTKYATLLKDGRVFEQNAQEAIKYYKIAIEKGSINALNDYAYMLEYGQGVEVNYEEALKYYKLAIDKGVPTAMNNYAMMLKNGEGVEVNYEEAAKYFKMAINEGVPMAMNNYAMMLQEGNGYLYHHEEIVKYLKMAIDKGIPEAMNNYAMILEHGIFCNFEEAVKYYKMAIDKGFPIAMYNYASMLEQGKGVKKDYNEAMKYYKMASDKGYPSAMNSCGIMFLQGRGVEKNYKEALKYFKMAIDKDEPAAMYHYATMLEEGKGIKANIKEAVKYYKMAADKGIPNAMYLYAYILQNGEGVEVNYKDAIKYYKMAADKGFLEAIYNYALMLQIGQGVEVNYEEAVKYHRIAINGGHKGSMYYYACLLQKGKGVERNSQEAIKYFKMAIDKDVGAAMYSYANMLREGDGIDVDYKEAIKYYKMAIDRNVTGAFNEYAKMLQNGQGVDVDYNEAIKYYKIAISKGDADAMYNYAGMLIKGEGVEENAQLGLKLLILAANKGHKDSIEMLNDVLKSISDDNDNEGKENNDDNEEEENNDDNEEEENNDDDNDNEEEGFTNVKSGNDECQIM